MCVRILRADGSKIGIGPRFAIIDETDRRQQVKEILDDLDYDDRQLTVGACLAEIDKAKNALVSPEQFAERATSFSAERIANVYTEYRRRLAASNALDFDDLILRTIELLEHDRATREKYQKRFQYVLVNEYQDINAAQYRFVALLASHHGNITVVGDDDQSIYSWRGSDYRMILRFEDDFAGAKIFKLEENYRSTQRILDAANALVHNNKTRAAKKLFTRRDRRRSHQRVSRRRPSATKRATWSKRSKSWCAMELPIATSCTLSYQRAIAGVRRGFPGRWHPVSGRRRRWLLRTYRNQRCHRVSSLHLESVGCVGV